MIYFSDFCIYFHVAIHNRFLVSLHVLFMFCMWQMTLFDVWYISYENAIINCHSAVIVLPWQT